MVKYLIPQEDIAILRENVSVISLKVDGTKFTEFLLKKKEKHIEDTHVSWELTDKQKENQKIEALHNTIKKLNLTCSYEHFTNSWRAHIIF